MAFTIRSEHASPDYVLTTLSDSAILDPNNGFAHTVTIGTSVPLGDLAPDVGITQAGPAAVVAMTIDGLWVDGAAITYGFTGPTVGTFGGTVANTTGEVVGPEDMAIIAATQLAAKHTQLNTQADGTTVFVSAKDGTDVTVTTWSVV